MKAVLVTPGCFDKGGISRYTLYQIRLLTELYGQENVRVFSLLGPDAHAFEQQAEVHWHGSDGGLVDKVSLVLHLLLTCLTWRPQVMFIGHVNLSGVCVAIARCFGIATVLNVYGLELWSGLSRDAAWGLRSVKHIVADCHNTASYLTDNAIRKADDLDVIWDCVDMQRFTPPDEVDVSMLRRYGIEYDRSNFYVLTLGRLSESDSLYKGYATLIRVVAEISRTEPRIQLIVAGRGAYAATLQELVRELQADRHVTFTGAIDENDLPGIYRSCDLFSLVTLSGKGMGEGIPLTPLEAMACGAPIMVGNMDGSREAVVEDVNGVCIDPTDTAAQARHIRAYVNDPAMQARHADGALRVARERFSYDLFKAKHVALLTRLRPS